MVENCENCAFGIEKWVHAGREIHCRRHSPIVVHISGVGQYPFDKTIWPKVEATDFCGDWELTDVREDRA